MRKVLFALAFVFTFTLHASGQWMEPDKTYFRIDIATDGIYRLSYDLLKKQGIPLQNIPTSHYQLFHLGKEIPLYSNSSVTLGPGDYLEFFGEKNRGEADEAMFPRGKDTQLNPEYSLFTDTAAYFLTWGSSSSLFRYSEAYLPTNCTAQPLDWFWQEQLYLFTDTHQKAAYRVGEVSLSYSHFDHNGFATALRQETHIPIRLPAVYEAGPAAQIALRLLANDNIAGHQLEIRLDDIPLFDTSFQGLQLISPVLSLPVKQLSRQVNLHIRGKLSQDRYATAFVRVKYPSLAEISSRNFTKFELPPFSNTRRLTLPTRGIDTFFLWDIEKQVRYSSVFNPGQSSLCLSPSFSGGTFLLCPSDQILQVGQLTPVFFKDFTKSLGDYIIITHPEFLGEGGAAEAYAQYRSAKFMPMIVDIRHLYDQYAWGIRRHPLAIRNFVHFLYQQQQVKYILLLGKGLEYPYLRSEQDLQQHSPNFFLPTWGTPPSDNLLASQAGQSTPLIPIGRIAATSSEQILQYLEKVKAFENSRSGPQNYDQKSWLKKVLHLSGGNGITEQQLLQNYLEDMGRLLEGESFGAAIHPWSQLEEGGSKPGSSSLFELINNGLAMLTFLGHSAPGSFDINLDNPERYANYNKYPFLLSLGCYSGNMFTPETGLAEKFCLMENTGTIAFAAGSGPGFLSALNLFGRTFYQKLGSQHYGASLGTLLQQSIQALESGNQNIILQTLAEQFVYHGDPALSLHPFEGADYLIIPNEIRINPPRPTLQDDTLRLILPIANLGKAIQDSLSVTVRFDAKQGATKVFFFGQLPSPFNKKELTLPIPLKGWQAGLYQTSLEITPKQAEHPMPEAQQNNSLSNAFSFELLPQKIMPLYPPDLAIYPEEKLLLQAWSHLEGNAGETLSFEIDTTPQFDSPYHLQKEIPLAAGLLECDFGDKTGIHNTIFWRCSSNQSPDTSELLSFTWLPKHPQGSMINHAEQFGKGTFKNLSQAGWSFGSDSREIRLLNHPGAQQGFYHNGQQWAGMWIWEISAKKAGVHVLAMNPLDGEFILNSPPGLYGSLNNFSRWPLPTFAFDTESPEGRISLKQFLEAIVPEGYFVMLYSGQQSPDDTYAPEYWEETGLTALLETEGATQVRELATRGSLPYLFFYQKGEGPLREQLQTDIRSPLIHTLLLPFPFSQGSYTTPSIGPVARWSKLEISTHFEDPTDVLTLILEEKTDDTTIPRLNTTLSKSTQDFDLSFLNSPGTSVIQARLMFRDSLYRTPATLRSLKFFFDPLPDVLFSKTTSLPDTLPSGTPLLWQGRVANISSTASDSVLLRYHLRDNKGTETSGTRYLPPIPGKSSIPLEINIPTRGHNLQQQLTIELNPRNSFRESNSQNNRIQSDVFLLPDKSAPEIEIRFDGNLLQPGQTVSSQPFISVKISDRQLSVHSDSASVRLYLKIPGENFIPVALTGNPQLEMELMDAALQTLEIRWQPSFDRDGLYQIKLEAKDYHGNMLVKMYDFNIITQAGLSACWVYPNPFSTNARFVFTLGGSDPLYDYKIQILTVTGRVVRELSASDLGAIYPGTRPTEYSWDGTDNFGDKLARGVYFYRIFESGKLIDPGKGSYFHRGTGKLVILGR